MIPKSVRFALDCLRPHLLDDLADDGPNLRLAGAQITIVQLVSLLDQRL
jgi:hypothetical protein